MGRKYIDLTGQRIGRLVVIGRIVLPTKTDRAMWRCRCDCGAVLVRSGGNLRRGTVASCGCYKREVAASFSGTHGQSKSLTYESWTQMRQRCLNPNHHAWASYGGRGITICAAWGSFEQFLTDMGERPVGTTLDRIDSNRGYEPGNCRWASNKEQQRNKRNNHLIEYEGERLPISVWAERTGIRAGRLWWRISHGWSVAAAFTTPVLTRHESGTRARKAQLAAEARWMGGDA